MKNYFNESIKNAFGSKRNFERELIYTALKAGNKGKIYLSLNRYLNYSLSKSFDKEDELVLLTCNLDSCDIYNFIEDIDYHKLEKSYLVARSLIESKQIVRI